MTQKREHTSAAYKYTYVSINIFFRVAADAGVSYRLFRNEWAESEPMRACYPKLVPAICGSIRNGTRPIYMDSRLISRCKVLPCMACTCPRITALLEGVYGV